MPSPILNEIPEQTATAMVTVIRRLQSPAIVLISLLAAIGLTRGGLELEH